MITSREFGRLPDGGTALIYCLKNSKGVSVSITNYGGIITSVKTPTRNGSRGEITLAYDDLDSYLSGHPYFGAMIGRVGNRVSGGGFTLDGEFHPISTNTGTIQLHGGLKGFDKKLFQADEVQAEEGDGIQLTLTSPDGDEGYPGTVDVSITVSLDEFGVLGIEYEAQTDKATPMNLTNHTYWNLEGAGTVLNHELELYADRVVITDERSIPTGELRDVTDTFYDFRQRKTIGLDFTEAKSLATNGYDHCYCLSGWDETDIDTLRPAAFVVAPHSGRTMSVWTTSPGFQFYTGNKLSGIRNRSGETLSGHEAFCLETQYYPDSVNQPSFPDTIVRPGETFHHRTEYRFGIVD